MAEGEEKRLQDMYKTKQEDHFTTGLEIKFFGKAWSDEAKAIIDVEPQSLIFERVTWPVPDPDTGKPVHKGLRYGENPGQEAALYRLISGNLAIGDVQTIQHGRWLASNAELLQSGKHPGKTNITDADNGMNILRYFMDEPVVAIFKHNNPCGVAIGEGLLEAYLKADAADRVAAFGGAIALNREVDAETAEEIVRRYSEVVVAPGFAPGAMGALEKRKNLRVMEIKDMAELKQWVGKRVIDFKSLMDGGLIAQLSFSPDATTLDDFAQLPVGYQEMKDGTRYKVNRAPAPEELRDLWFGWLVESGITSNSVIYVKNGVTVGIGTGEQDRVGVAKIARDKAYEKLTDRLCYERMGSKYNDFLLLEDNGKLTKEQARQLAGIRETVREMRGGLKGARAVSDAFFPFRDGIDVGLREGVTAIVQPGGSERDYESIEACNEAGAAMIYTKQRSFKH